MKRLNSPRFLSIKAAVSDEGLKAGVNTYARKLTYEAVAVSQNRARAAG